MPLRGLVLIGFSGLCLALVGLAHHESSGRGCMSEGIVTSAGRVACLQPVSAAIGQAMFGISPNRGSAMSQR